MANFIRVKCDKTVKEISGFSNGIVYLVKGDSFPYKTELKELGARFRRDFCWYFGSWCEKPDTLPGDLTFVELRWEEVGLENGDLKNEEIIKSVIESKMFEKDSSEHVGSIGERLEVSVTVENKREFEGTYGNQFCYTFRDEDNNCLVWFTSVSSKTSFDVGEEYVIRGTVKSHDTYRNCAQTQLSRVTKRG